MSKLFAKNPVVAYCTARCILYFKLNPKGYLILLTLILPQFPVYQEVFVKQRIQNKRNVCSEAHVVLLQRQRGHKDILFPRLKRNISFQSLYEHDRDRIWRYL